MMQRSLHSFPFFIKECSVLCILFRSLLKNAAFFAFFYVLYKRTRHSLRSFTFFIKERGVLCVLFIRLKKSLTSFFQYIFIYIYNYLYIYIEKKNATFCILLQKNETFSRSFTFFAKERNVLCVLLRSLQKNVVFFAFFYVLKKRTQKNALFFWVS